MNESTLTPEEQKDLLRLARQAIASGLKLDHDPVEVVPTPNLTARSGAFVTLHKFGALRGCIGRFTSDGPLTETVQAMARAAAFEDPRFPQLDPNEFTAVELEISVLTPMEPINDIHRIEVGKHGLYMINGYYRGVLLPQVAVEQGWDRMTFLEHTCRKAGLGADCWKDKKTEIFIFSAEVFGE